MSNATEAKSTIMCYNEYTNCVLHTNMYILYMRIKREKEDIFDAVGDGIHWKIVL